MILLAMLCHCLESSAQCTLNVTPHANITVLCHCCLTQCDSNKTWLKERCFIVQPLGLLSQTKGGKNNTIPSQEGRTKRHDGVDVTVCH